VDSKRALEVAFTALLALFLIVAVEGRHPYSFYVVLRLATTVGGGVLGGRCTRQDQEAGSGRS